MIMAEKQAKGTGGEADEKDLCWFFSKSYLSEDVILIFEYMDIRRYYTTYGANFE